ncbi:Uncharacterized protein PECH_005970 [Penicillium ucsense]|uniref:Nucleic acid-binding protein n=1 Tax=Penicillium ucsense TaxID=2839758 RepID=A0A8J8W5R2_9EURO|nr:Uncharacterized protein PECM_006461 [Penicillium ucsense]KAF7735936.1 Uncharacterized protein PECH_005970 [Penicillium ucsense]
MATGYLVRAMRPMQSIATTGSLARSSIIRSTTALGQSVRYNSYTPTEATQEPTVASSSSPAPSTSTPLSLNDLEPPTLLRNYASKTKSGTVVSVGRMDRTVTVVYRSNEWDKHVRKYYRKDVKILVSDPQNSLRKGDVIEFSSGAPKSHRVHHVVERIITPFAVPIEDRPAVMTKEEREQERARRWAAKYVRRESRRLGEEINLETIARAHGYIQDGESLSAAELIHRIFEGQERIGKVKKLVQERVGEVQA